MQISRKLGLTLVAAALVTVYGCGQKTEQKAETKATRRVGFRLTERLKDVGQEVGMDTDSVITHDEHR